MPTVAKVGAMMASLLLSLNLDLHGAHAEHISSDVPTGLLVDWQVAPALGVSTMPSFGWVVPPCAGVEDTMQTGYTLQLFRDGATSSVWSSGAVAANSSVNVKYTGPELELGTAYEFTVTTKSAACTSPPSARALFVTAVKFAPTISWIGAGVSNATFNILRRVVQPPAPATVQRVIGYITAQNSDPTMLMNFKLYVDGRLASTGPGRGEAPIAGGDGVFRAQPYVTADLTEFFSKGGPTLLALQTMEFGGFQPCPPGKECNGKTQFANGPAVMMQIDVHLKNSSQLVTWVTEAGNGWKAMDADSWFRPAGKQLAANGAGGRRAQQCVLKESRPFYGKLCERATGTTGSAGTGRIENTDARNEPVGWRDSATFDDSTWPAAVSISTPSLVASELTPRMAGPAVQIIPDIQPARTGPGAIQTGHRNNMYSDAMGVKPTSFFVDFGKEFQGGLRLHVEDGKAGQTVKLQSGEMCTPLTNQSDYMTSESCTTVQQDWQWDFTWTLRDGDQMIEQHQYMEFRYLSVVFDGEPPANWNVSAWGVQAPWDPDDTHFKSSNEMLNKVWELSSYTLQAAVTDTYADSNTRERRPYEADGLIAAGNRLLLQRSSIMWARHSHSWIMQFPTWPVEWLQITPFLAWQDYWATGQTDLMISYEELLYNNTQIQWVDEKTGLINTSKPISRPELFGDGPGRHIIGWDPQPAKNMFTKSDFMSVPNLFTVGGLELLAKLANIAGKPVPKYATQAAALRKAVVARMWDSKAERFCDGPCATTPSHGIYSDMYPLWMGLVPKGSAGKVWKSVVDWGLEQIGDYGAFIYFSALAKYPVGDTGEAALAALTKCDDTSWCHMIKAYDATMTREGFSSGTMSHAWGTAPITGIVNGLMGLAQEAPAYKSFSVKPRLGGVASASVKVPTPHGHIWINATSAGQSVAVSVPCNTRASLCAVIPPSSNLRLALDGQVMLSDDIRMDGQYACVDAIGCGSNGAVRSLTWV